ncbi:helix-turn-helix domain-containing protein [Streptomyces cucumeris]|uniref:helix-turn-helix domain-containing protein n=1 Tax=Streptomyces cucumeris TaxID=2962890 RepID=UPI0020C883C7|nr:helix-turn-helix domain-containing protein [Streptomyces sp. NEAU-Y11]MCP9207099.1 helix-turn-helix domain-containing protein [Streptomyces sp. NEAU-Y11]
MSYNALLTEPLLYRMSDAMRVLSLSRSVIYDQIRRGRLRTVKEGRTRLVPASAITEYVALLEREAGEAR